MKRNEFDLTVKELQQQGISVDDYGKAGEKCIAFLNHSPIKPFSSVIKMETCDRILDQQRKNETFSETAERIGLFRYKNISLK